jgi:glycosyltransferase involved in cell wall biosynthesis
MDGVHIHEVPLVVKRGGKLRYLYQYGLFSAMSATVLARLHRSNPLHLVHVHSLPDFQVFSAFPLKVRRVPILLDLHEAMPEILGARFHLSPRSLWVRVAVLLEAASVRFADHVIAANDAIKGAIVARGVPPEKITAVYSAGEPVLSMPAGDHVRNELGLPAARYLVHAGGINPERDLETLLAAFARLPSGWGFHLVVAGDGDSRYMRLLMDLSSRLGIERRVHFVGRVPRETAHALMSLSDLGVVTLEANPLTDLAWPTRVIEFARMGKLLVVPRLKFLRETLGNGARYYTPGDPESLREAISAALTADAARGTMITAAEQVVRRFDWARMRELLLRVVRGLEGSYVT